MPQKPVKPSTLSPRAHSPLDVSQVKPSMEDVMAAQKNCKFANSALDYDDYPTAITNLLQALKNITGRNYVPM